MNHGTESGYTTHRQRGEDACGDCREAHRVYHREWRRRNRKPRLTGATAAREHLAQLVAEGSTLRALSQRTGVSHTTLKDILNGRAIIQTHTARAILAAPVVYGERIPAAGTARRIRALNAIGWSSAHLGARLGVSRDRVAQYASAEWVERPTAAKVASLYDELSMTLGPSARARTWASKRGDLPPLAWDDDTIDEVTEFLHTPESCTPTARSVDDIDEIAVERFVAGDLHWNALTRAERIAAALEMDRLGYSRNVIAERTRLNSATLWGAFASESRENIAS